MPLIHGKQLRPDTLKENLLFITGNTNPTTGQILAYDGAIGGFDWVNNTGGVSSVTAGGGLSGNTTIDDITLVADVDNSSIFLNGSNQISLGDPNTGDIGFGTSNTYRFVGSGNQVIVEGDFTVNGTSTFINSQNLAITDNIIMINSGSTVGFGTAGISVDLGNGSFSDILWHESNGGYWAIDNPDGSGATQTFPILTTDSIDSNDNSITVTQGTGIDFDKLNIEVDESNLSNIPNSALTNDSITIVAGPGLVGGGTVALGGSITLTAEDDTFVTGGSYNNNTQEITFTGNTGFSTFTVDLSDLDFNDTFSTGTTNTVLATNNSNTQSVDITGNDGFTDFTVSLTDTFITGGTFNNGTGLITFTNNNGDDFTVDLNALDLNDTFITGGTVSNGTVNLELNDGTDFDLTGDVVQSVTGDSPITASTSNGVVNVGLDYSSLQQSIPSTDDKNVTANTTSGDEENSGAGLTDTPIGGYVGVSVNGVWYNVGDGVKTSDCYFSGDGGSTAKSFGNMVSGDGLYWNGDIVGFDLDTNDSISIYYNVLA